MSKLIAVGGITLVLVVLGACGAGQKPGDLLASCVQRADAAGGIQYRCMDIIARTASFPRVEYASALEQYRDASEARENRKTAHDFCGHKFETLPLGGAPRRMLRLLCTDHTTQQEAGFVDMAVALPLAPGTRIVSCAFEFHTSDQYQLRRQRCEEVLDALVQQAPASAPASAPGGR